MAGIVGVIFMELYANLYSHAGCDKKFAPDVSRK